MQQKTLIVTHNKLTFAVPIVSEETTTTTAVTQCLSMYSKLTNTAASDAKDATLLLLQLQDQTLLPPGVPLSLFDSILQAVHYRVCLIAPAAPEQTPSSATVTTTTSDWVRINAGGTIFHTCRSTLCKADPDSMLAKMFASDLVMNNHKDASGAFLLDVDPTYFRVVVNFLRTGHLSIDDGVSRDGVQDVAAFLQVPTLLRELQHQPPPAVLHHRVMILACRLASWIGMSGAVPGAIPRKYKFGKTRKYGNQWELNSHSNELVALILNDLTMDGWKVLSCSAGGAGADISVYQSYVLIISSSEPFNTPDTFDLQSLGLPTSPK